MAKLVLQTVIFCLAVAGCLALGKLTVWAAAGLPASLYGMLYFCLILHLGWIDADLISEHVGHSIVWMPIVFLPICVGVIEYKEILQSFGFSILIIGLTTTLLTIACVGWSAQTYTKQRGQLKK